MACLPWYFEKRRRDSPTVCHRAFKEGGQVGKASVDGRELEGSQFRVDNFKVSQLLESALADGSATI